MEEGYRLAAPAKLNLSLRVVGRRPDGLHQLEGVMVLLELADELRFLPAISGDGDGDGGLRVTPTGVAMPQDAARNLAWRGLVAGLGRAPSGHSLALAKRIPVAAGLGGGSSDAAAAWRLGRRSTGAAELPTAEELTRLAEIGADVPFFAAQAVVARVTGAGERVEPAELPAGSGREVVLVVASAQLSTAAVFAELREDEWGSGGPEGNDLLDPARRLCPEIDELRRLVLAAGLEPRLTGSGPTLFALLDEPSRADAAAARLAKGGVNALRTRLRAEPASIELMAATMEEPEPR